MRRFLARSSLLVNYSEVQKHRATYFADQFSTKIFCGRYESLKKLFKKEVEALSHHEKYFENFSNLLKGSTDSIKSPTKYKEKLDQFNVYYLDADALAQALAEKTIKFIADLPSSAKMRDPLEVENLFFRIRNVVRLSTWSYNVLMDENSVLELKTPPVFDSKKILKMMEVDNIEPDLYTIKTILKIRSMNCLDILDLIKKYSISLDTDCYLMLIEDSIEMSRIDLIEY